jgi:hypothetical protein
MPLDPTFFNLPPKIFTDFPKVKNWTFSGRILCADSEYMLDVAKRPIFA